MGLLEITRLMTLFFAGLALTTLICFVHNFIEGNFRTALIYLAILFIVAYSTWLFY